MSTEQGRGEHSQASGLSYGGKADLSSPGSGESGRLSHQGGGKGRGVGVRGGSGRRGRGRVEEEDPRQKLMKRLIPLLFVGLGGAIFWSVRSTVPSCKGADKQAVETEAEAELSSVSSADIVIDWERPAAVTGPVCNPMLRAETKAVTEPVGPEDVVEPLGQEDDRVLLELTGIVYSADDPSAIVEKKIVHTGDMVRGVRVVAITETSVEFEQEGQRWRQELGQ